MTDLPFVAIGNDELGEPVGESIKCRVCGEQHAIEYGKIRTLRDDGTWTEYTPSKVLGFYRCDGRTYLASLDGRAVA